MRFAILKTLPTTVRYRYSLSIEGFGKVYSWAFTEFPKEPRHAAEGKQCVVTVKEDALFEGRDSNRVVVAWDHGEVLCQDFDPYLEHSTFVLWGSRVRGKYELKERQSKHNLWWIRVLDPTDSDLRRIRV